MTNPDLATMTAAAEEYEAFFVPALLGELAGRMVGAAHIQQGQRVLDVACGTGILARTAARRVGPDGFVAGLDVNPGMLAVASRLAPNIEWQQGQAEALPYAEATFDAAVCQLGLMFFSDRRQALREMMRVLVPGGRMACAVWNALEKIPAFAIEIELIERNVGRTLEPLRSPFALGDTETLRNLMADAGVPSAAISTQKAMARFPSVRSIVETDVRGWLPLMGVALKEENISRIIGEVEQALVDYVRNGAAVLDVSVHIVTATKP